MEMNYLIGNKDSFAIEFSVDRERYTQNLGGWLRLWLGGKYVGAYENICILGITLNALEHFVRKNINTEDFKSMNKENIYQLIESAELGKYWFSPGGDSFDDFLIIVYSQDGAYKFIWKLCDEPFFYYENYPKGFQCAEVNSEIFKQVIVDFKMQLDRLEKEIPILVDSL